jgi:hypothetical protein
MTLPPYTLFFFLRFLFDLEDGDDMFLRNIGLSPKLYGVTARFNIILHSTLKLTMLYLQKKFHSRTSLYIFCFLHTQYIYMPPVIIVRK